MSEKQPRDHGADRKVAMLPKSVQEMAKAYGEDFRFSQNPVGDIVELIFTPEELTDEAVARAWRRVDRFLDTRPLL